MTLIAFVTVVSLVIYNTEKRKLIAGFQNKTDVRNGITESKVSLEADNREHSQVSK